MFLFLQKKKLLYYQIELKLLLKQLFKDLRNYFGNLSMA